MIPGEPARSSTRSHVVPDWHSNQMTRTSHDGGMREARRPRMFGSVIRVRRSTAGRPTQLDVKVPRETQRAREFFEDGGVATRQQGFQFDSGVFGSPHVRNSLYELFSGRCAYCTLAWPAEALEIDHFRPLQGAVSANGESSRIHYYWLANEWENLYPACAQCNMAKGAKFPVAGKRASPGTTHDDLEAEKPGLIDPCAEDPERIFAYLPSGQVVTTDVRGRQTIDVLALNRPDLVSERRKVAAEAVLIFQGAVSLMQREDYDGCASAIAGLFDMTRPLAGVRRQFATSRVYLRRRQLDSPSLRPPVYRLWNP